MSRAFSWFEEHPKVAVAISIAVLWVAIDNYTRVVNWADGLEQIAASESLGG